MGTIILSNISEMSLTYNEISKLILIIGTLWGGYKIIMEIINKITARHDREQSWDSAVKKIEVDRESLENKFNERLDEHDAKNQQLIAMMCMCLRANDAILEALVDKDIGNGEIRSMHRELKEFILNQVQQ